MSSSNSSFEDHGGPNPSELIALGIDPSALIDFSVNSNPFGPSPKILETIRKVNISKYPDRFCAELTSRLADVNHVERDCVLTGNGTAELIWLITRAFLRPGDEVVILGPTFGDYARAVGVTGVQVTEFRAEPPGYQPPLESLLHAIRTIKPRLVFICNPNNPTGHFLPDADIEKISSECAPDTILVLDEAYRSFAGQGFFGGLPVENCIILRSMTKDFALAGLRLGYILARPQHIQTIARFQPSWSVNGLAQAAGLTALEESAWYIQTLEALNFLKGQFFRAIEVITLSPMNSSTHFGVIRVPVSAGSTRRWFLDRGIQVRDCSSFGLPDHIRVSTQLTEDNLRFIEGMRVLFLENSHGAG